MSRKRAMLINIVKEKGMQRPPVVHRNTRM